MQLNMEIIGEELQKVFHVSDSNFRQLHRLYLESPAILTESPNPHTLYVSDCGDLPQTWNYPGHTYLILSGRIVPHYFDGADVEYICISNASFTQVFNKILDIFQKFNHFADFLQTQTVQRTPPAELCDFVSDFLDVPFIIVDSSLRVLYCSENANDLLEWETDFNTGLRLLPTEFVNQMNLVLFDLETSFSSNTVLLKDDRLQYNLVTIFDPTEPCNLIAFEAGKELTDNLTLLFDYSFRFLKICFEYAPQDISPNSSLVSLLVSMLDGNKISASDLENQLTAHNWKTDDNCCCFVLKSQMDSEQNPMISFTLGPRLENLFSACVSFPYDDFIVCVVNLDKSGCPFYDVSQKIATLLRDGLLRAGISFRYWIFEATPIYYHQACYAYEIGQTYNPTCWYYSFQDYALYYMLHYGSSLIPPRHLCHPGIVNLYRYDQDKGTDLLNTMKTYAQNDFNVAEAAKKLFIHRNTLYQRLARIQTIAKFNLDDYEERLYIQLSYKLIDMYYYELGSEFLFPVE